MASNPEKNQDLIVLKNLSTALIRGEALFRMTTDYLNCSLQSLVSAPLQGVTNSGSLSALDLYGLLASEALEILLKREIQHEFRRVDNVCAVGLGDMAWTIQNSDSILVLTDSEVNADGVVTEANARVLGVQKQQNDPLG